MNNLQQEKMNVKIADPWETLLSLILISAKEKDKATRLFYADLMLECLEKLTVKED